MSFQALRGFRDYLPPDTEARARVFATLRAVARGYGFDEVESPSVESLDLLKAKSGDAIAEETFAFRDKGGRDVSLVPENTPSLARIFAERAKVLPLPVKWFALPRLWRYEEPQSGRLREFLQCSLDIYGVAGPSADVEILLTTRAMLEALGLTGRYLFRLNDRRLVSGVARSLGVAESSAFFRALDRRDKLSPAEFGAELGRAGLDGAAQDRLGDLLRRCQGGLVGAAAQRELGELAAWPGMDAEARSGAENVAQVLRRAEGAGLGEDLRFDPTVIRGLAYYTSTVFEAYAKGGPTRALFGGGRYDRLIEQFGGGAVPACGVAMGDQTLELLLREADLWPKEPKGLDVYVACADPALAAQVLPLVLRLRGAGLDADYDLLDRGLTRQMKEAARRRTRTLVLLGPREWAEGNVVLRNMQTGRQDAVPSASVVERLAPAAPGPRGAAPAEGAGGGRPTSAAPP